MIDWQSTLLMELRGDHVTRIQIADTYACLLGQSGVDYAKVNRAIMERWSKSGLRYVKERAWKRREEMERGLKE